MASDGKLRTGTITAETDKPSRAELKRQGLTPVYVGLEEKKPGSRSRCRRSSAGGARTFCSSRRNFDAAQRRRAARPRAFDHGELTEHGAFPHASCSISCGLIKGGKSLADSLATHPLYFSELYVNMVRAGEASGSLAQIFERLAEFERTRDDLRSYIISSLIYPGLLTLVGIASIFVLLNFVVPRFAPIFSDPRMKIPLPTLMLLASERLSCRLYWLPARDRAGGG